MILILWRISEELDFIGAVSRNEHFRETVTVRVKGSRLAHYLTLTLVDEKRHRVRPIVGVFTVWAERVCTTVVVTREDDPGLSTCTVQQYNGSGRYTRLY